MATGLNSRQDKQVQIKNPAVIASRPTGGAMRIIKPGTQFRSIDKTSYKGHNITQKCELDRVNQNIQNRFRISLEPLDTKKLLKGNPREVNESKWLNKVGFNPITSGESHRKFEYAKLRLKEPYVTH